MSTKQRSYIAIDLKSFYASVECVERGLDPLKTNLVVADASRTEKTICLAVSPSLKTYGIPGRARLFEVIQRLKEVNYRRRAQLSTRQFTGKSVFADDLVKHRDWEVDYIAAPPRMAFYIDYSSRIYRTYLKYIAPEDIYAYSIDEVFIDATNYLSSYRMTAHELARTMIKDVLATTGITATAGIGPNLYLSKVAMDIVAKHIAADKDGVRIAELDELSYREQLWGHRPLTDFWRVGHGIARRLESNGIYTMGQLARCSLQKEELLYKLFGVNAELLIDHAWGWEPCTIDAIKSYRPESHSLSSGQVLHCPYNFEHARIVAQEMADGLALSLVEKHLMTDSVAIYVGYDVQSLIQTETAQTYQGETGIDYYGRMIPKPTHGGMHLDRFTSSSQIISQAIISLYDQCVNPKLLIRRINVVMGNVVSESRAAELTHTPKQLNLFADYEEEQLNQGKSNEEQAREHKVQEALLSIKKKYGKNAILKGFNFEDGATAKERNQQIGGHKA
ncbi:MAG: DNA methylase [Bacteroidales bacterium]|nr:DNA methylase [Bacteroidales bacterium]